MGQTLTEKLIRAAATGRTFPGSRLIEVQPELVLGHDATIALILDRIADSGRALAHPERLFLVADHFSPPSTVDRANILRRFLDFAESAGAGEFRMMQGICHQVLVESARCRPGSLIVGADSHTTMAGAVGCFAAGMGSTDILAVLLTGRTWLEVPPTIRFDFTGQMPPWLRGKDLALWMAGTIGEGGARYRALSFSGDVPMDGRLTLCNMAVDVGAKNGVWIPDDTTRRWVAARPGSAAVTPTWMTPDDDAPYEARHTRDLSALPPQLARPYSPADVCGVDDVVGEKVHQVFIGSCAGGRLEEIGDAARLLRGRRVPRFLKLVVTPASMDIYRAALTKGYLTDLIDAGAVVTNPSCGACGGVDKGLLAAGEVCVSTSNRNFRGRMGDVDARVFLASGLTAAAAALTGRITDPREVMA